jgi:hypothetical protein
MEDHSNMVREAAGLDGQSAPQKGGLYLPETIISTDNILSRLRELGINIIEDID